VWQADGVPRLDSDDALRRLMTVPVLRLATADEHGRPHVVTVTFAASKGAVYTAIDHKPKSTRALRRLANIRANPRVSLLADHYEDDWDRLWWVRVDGHASIVEDEQDMAEPIALLAGRYHQYREHPPEGPVIAILIDHWTGWTAT
jgi:PPOX class probable F420-dependent enzyme